MGSLFQYLFDLRQILRKIYPLLPLRRGQVFFDHVVQQRLQVGIGQLASNDQHGQRDREVSEVRDSGFQDGGELDAEEKDGKPQNDGDDAGIQNDLAPAPKEPLRKRRPSVHIMSMKIRL